MPTEYRSSNTEMVSVQRQTLENVLRDGSSTREVHAAFLQAQQSIRTLLDQPAQQPHPEPIAWMVGTAFWWTKEEADRDAAATGLPIVGLGPMTDRAAIELAECESMADMVAEREWAEHAGTGPVSSKVEAAFTQLHNDLHEAGETLAERDALLRELADAPPAAMEFRLQQKVKAALSASAEPSAPGVLPRAHDVNMFQRTAEPGAKS